MSTGDANVKPHAHSMPRMRQGGHNGRWSPPPRILSKIKAATKDILAMDCCFTGIALIVRESRETLKSRRSNKWLDPDQ